MIGYYDYSMFLTYLSAVSAVVGVVLTLSAGGHPHLGTAALLLCGLCDAFDGKVARTKSDRTELEKRFGIQVDSLADLLAFGMLPAAIGAALYRQSLLGAAKTRMAYSILLFAVMALYVLAALIRLAYFNVTEEERQQLDHGARRTYVGLPVTASALISPAVMLLGRLLPMDITPVYLSVMLFTGAAFVGRFRVRKPGLRGILALVALGLAEFVLLLVLGQMR